MLKIYYGRENLRKDKFIFDSIQGKTLLLVPDQFTLQAERDAFFYLGVKGFMDLDVVSISRLGSKILSETGGGKTPMINKYGRHMLLAKILRDNADRLQLYRGMEKKQAFIEMMNNFISELKQYGTDPQQLKDIADSFEKDTFLERKLKDVQVIFSEYEEQIAGKYTDTEDYVSLYAGKISDSQKIRESEVWIYGFDSFTPKNLEVIRNLIPQAKHVNIVLTYSGQSRDRELFSLTHHLMNVFSEMAENAGIAWEKVEIPEIYAIEDRAAAVKKIEQELYSLPVQPWTEKELQGLTLVKAANFYSEAETAAAKVLSLVRDEGLKYNEIILICNDLETRGTIAKRIFRQYGMELFLDKKQNVLHDPASVFLLSLLELADGKFNTEAIFRLLKTDLTGLPWEMTEQLENYARKYRIKGRRWTASFVKGGEEYGEEKFEELERTREQIIAPITSFYRDFRECSTVRECVQTVYRYLTEVYDIPGKLEELMNGQETMGLLASAAQTAQVWGCIIDVLDQLTDITGDEKLAADSFADILKAGLEAIELGLLPPSADGLIMGTMQRTRSSHVKAMLVLGANEGLLPASAESNSILSEDEKKRLLENKIEICKVDEIRQQEEKLAIYKNFSKPQKELWISYSASDEKGDSLKPSQLINTLHEIFPEIKEEQDIVSGGEPGSLMQAADAGKEHLAAALRGAAADGNLDPEWRKAIGWYQKNGGIERLRESMAYTGKQQDISNEFVMRLYRNDSELGALIMSPSRLESYSRCPFAHFIQFGLKPEEQRVFEVGSREIGDIYHNCFMELFRWLGDDNVDICDPDSRWSRITKEECTEKVAEILERDSAEYKEGLMSAGEEEKYRSSRLKEICSEIGWILINHVKEGKVHSMGLEKEFGRRGDIPPVTVETENGKVLIEGKIDRIDVLDDDRIKIIDYKTGRENFDADEARKGYRLQLMLYLRAAQEEKHKPAGVFYFLIDDPKVDVQKLLPEEVAENVDREVMNSYKMKGAMINDEQIIRSIAGEFEKSSSIVSLKRTKNGYYDNNTGTLMEEAEFEELQQQVNEKIKEICDSLLTGKTPAYPMKTSRTSACAFCQFRSICQFDTEFEDCNYNIL